MFAFCYLYRCEQEKSKYKLFEWTYSIQIIFIVVNKRNQTISLLEIWLNKTMSDTIFEICDGFEMVYSYKRQMNKKLTLKVHHYALTFVRL